MAEGPDSRASPVGSDCGRSARIRAGSAVAKANGHGATTLTQDGKVLVIGEGI
jgi:hypothetical protein